MRHGDKAALLAALFTLGCSADVRVQSQTAEAPRPEPPPSRAEAPATFQDTSALPLFVTTAICGGRPNTRKAQLALSGCSSAASYEELQELHGICTRDKDRECHHATHLALRTWHAESGVREPVAASLCEIRSKEALLGLACEGRATEETLTDLIRRCRRHDPGCESIARKALTLRNPALAKKLR